MMIREGRVLPIDGTTDHRHDYEVRRRREDPAVRCASVPPHRPPSMRTRGPRRTTTTTTTTTTSGDDAGGRGREARMRTLPVPRPAGGTTTSTSRRRRHGAPRRRGRIDARRGGSWQSELARPFLWYVFVFWVMGLWRNIQKITKFNQIWGRGGSVTRASFYGRRHLRYVDRLRYSLKLIQKIL